MPMKLNNNQLPGLPDKYFWAMSTSRYNTAVIAICKETMLGLSSKIVDSAEVHNTAENMVDMDILIQRANTLYGNFKNNGYK